MFASLIPMRDTQPQGVPLARQLLQGVPLARQGPEQVSGHLLRPEALVRQEDLVRRSNLRLALGEALVLRRQLLRAVVLLGVLERLLVR